MGFQPSTVGIRTHFLLGPTGNTAGTSFQVLGWIAPENRADPKRKRIVFQPSIFEGLLLLVAGRVTNFYHSKGARTQKIGKTKVFQSIIIFSGGHDMLVF